MDDCFLARARMKNVDAVVTKNACFSRGEWDAGLFTWLLYWLREIRYNVIGG